MSTKIAVIYYSSTGNVHALAEAVREGAEKADAEVRFRRVPELAPDSAIDSQPAWRSHLSATAHVETATHEDLRWADAYAFGTPVRFGTVASQLKQFIDTTGGLWYAGELSGKPFTGFTSAINMHGGNEATLLDLYHVAFHWGSVIVPPGYNDPSVPAAYGNPYGAAHPSGNDSAPPNELILEAARFQGFNLATVTARLRAPQSV